MELTVEELETLREIKKTNGYTYQEMADLFGYSRPYC